MSPRSRDLVLGNLTRIRAGIERACARVGRDPGEVRIVAAGKTVEAEALGWVREAGVRDFGENYVQELRSKRDAVPGATWHFIGTLQSHSAHRVAELADIVETAVPGKALARLARRSAEAGRRLPTLVEVDFTDSRVGVSPEEALAACEDVAASPGLSLLGLMTIPPVTATAEGGRPYFARLRELRERLVERHREAVELSMGMSLDYEVAIEEGATMVRIGTALFGARIPTG